MNPLGTPLVLQLEDTLRRKTNLRPYKPQLYLQQVELFRWRFETLQNKLCIKIKAELYLRTAQLTKNKNRKNK